MRRPLFLLAGLCLPFWITGLIASGCGSNVEIGPSGQAGNGAGGGEPSSSSSSAGGNGLDAGHHDAFDDYEDPGCPDAGPPLQQFECDPFKQNNGDCGPGNGCYITVTYPTEQCGQETYGSVCLPEGPGGQDDPCNGAQDCKAGFACVVAGIGQPQCIRLCHLTGPSSDCPQGLLCEPIDVEGFGGCL
jgi:hypothetical protein